MSLRQWFRDWQERVDPAWPEWSCPVCHKPQYRRDHDCLTRARVFAPPLGPRPSSSPERSSYNAAQRAAWDRAAAGRTSPSPVDPDTMSESALPGAS